MSDNSDLIKLYSKRILALAADIPHVSRLEQPQASAKKRAPLCGSTVTVDLICTTGQISEFGQNVRACALGQAAASVLGQVVIGLDRAALLKARTQLHKMLTEDGPTPAAPFEGLEVLRPAREFKNRHASILLAFDATLEALDMATDAQAPQQSQTHK